MFAVVKISGKQYKVSVGDSIAVDKIDQKVGSLVIFKDIYLVQTEKNVLIGTPVVKGYEVSAEITKQIKGDKIEVRRYKSKVRHRRHIGFRAQLTELLIKDIKRA